jgi:hypothetical protein
LFRYRDAEVHIDIFPSYGSACPMQRSAANGPPLEPRKTYP